MSENIETPEGWERMGHRFVRAYGHKLAVMANDSSDGTWLPWIHESVNSVYQGRWLPLRDAVAWANEQLGLPKPVKVVRVVCEDAILEYSSDRKRSARYEPIGIGSAEVVKRHQQYVRGDA